ncbi:MAG: hypothetical protein ACXU9O_01465 [Gemmatimonadaceae bacterium]
MPRLHRTTRIASCCIVAALAGCAKKNDATVDTTSAMASSSTTSTTATTTPPPAPAPINLADVAGKWDMHAVPASGDTTPTNFVLTATGTTSGWSIKYPGRPSVPERVTVAGDSIVTSAGPYPSFRRKGVTVTTDGVFRLQNGSLVGTNTAHYKVKTADSVLVLNTTGTRAK